MAIAKMTDNVISTPDFIVTLTHQNRSKASQKAEEPDVILEIVPLIHNESLKRNLARKFFDSITCPKERTRQSEKAIADFTSTCTPSIREEFLENLHPEYLEELLSTQEVLVILRDKDGEVLKSSIHLSNTLCTTLSKLELSCIYRGLNKKKALAETAYPLEHKKDKREWNRATRKYFLHHTYR